MPELPEVETVRRVLKTHLLNTKIINIDLYYDKIIEDKDYFIPNVINKTIIDISRLGKYLIFNLDEGNIISHLRMEGKYFYTDEKSPLNKHVHVVFHLDNNHYLQYMDVRKFGRMEYKITQKLYNTLPLSKLGVEPVGDIIFDYDAILKKINNKKLPIKTVLLDQEIITGLGNIYVDEVLFKSHLNPTTLAYNITLEDCKNILNNAKAILEKAIEYKGTTIRSYTSSLNVFGQYQDFLKVHTKTKCECGCDIVKIKIGGRGTYYCPSCQK